MQPTNKHFNPIGTKELVAETVKLLKVCWETEAFGNRLVCSLLEICMCECEARGFEFVPVDGGLQIKYNPIAPLKASDLNPRWDDK